jgi:formylglycine-generating enzyme required for sulfatase activity
LFRPRRAVVIAADKFPGHSHDLIQAATSPVTAFPPNGYGLHDMIGNVWESTTDWYAPKHEGEAARPCCVPADPRGAAEQRSYDPQLPDIKIPRKVLKGGSHLCAPNIAAATGRPRAMRSRSTRRQVTSDFAVSAGSSKQSF